MEGVLFKRKKRDQVAGGKWAQIKALGQAGEK